MIRGGWFYIYGIIYVKAVDLKISKHEGNERSVNLALDTVLEFNNKDNVADMSFLDNVQKFIGKVKTVIEKKSLMRRNFDSVNNDRFTDFIQNLIQVLNKFNDTDLEYFFTVAADEMRKYHYKGCKFHELTANTDLRRFLATKLTEIKNTPAAVMRRKLEAIANKIEEAKYDPNEKELIDYINSLYGESSITLFHRTLSSVDDYRLKTRVNMNLPKIINKGIRSVLFDYYTELNSNARMALQIKLNEFYKNLMKDLKSVDFEKQDMKIAKTTKEITVKPKYVNQYVHLKHDTFKYGPRSHEKKPATSRVSESFKEVGSLQIHSNELRRNKRKKHAEIFNKRQQLFHNKKSATHIQNTNLGNARAKTKYTSRPYYKKDTSEKYDPYAHEHLKIDAKFKERTPKRIHPINSPIVDELTKTETKSSELDNSQSHNNKYSYQTPKDPGIDSDRYQNEELRFRKTTKSRKRDHITFHSFMITVKPKLGGANHKKIVRSELKSLNTASTDGKRSIVTLYPINNDIESNLDDGENIKQKVDRLFNEKVLPRYKKPEYNYDLEFQLTPAKKSDKTPKDYDTEDDDKLASHKVKNSAHNFELIEKLEKIQNSNRNAKSHTIKRSTRPTKEPDSVEFIAFEDDDLGGIDQGLKMNLKQKSKLPNSKVTVKTKPEKNLNRATNTKRVKSNRLTFMTLYPEFIQKWSTLNSRAEYRQRAQSDDAKQIVRHKNRGRIANKYKEPDMSLIDMPPYIPQEIKKIINSKSSTPAKTIEMAFQTKKQFKKENVKYTPTIEFNKHEINKNMDSSQPIQETLKKLRNSEIFGKRPRQMAFGGNIKSTDPVDSNENLSAEESTEKVTLRTFRRQNLNITRGGPFIDINVLTQTETKTVTNTDKYIHGNPKQKYIKFDHLNKDETLLQNKKENVNERSDSQSDDHSKPPYMVSKKSPSLVGAHHYSVTNKKSARNAFKSNTNDKWLNSYKNGLKIDKQSNENKLKEHFHKTYDFGGDKYESNLNRRGFIDPQKPKGVNDSAGEVKNVLISSKENVVHLDQSTHNDIEPKHTSNQSTKNDKNVNTIGYTQNYNELYDTNRKKKMYFSYSNNAMYNKDRAGYNVAHKSTIKTEQDSIKSTEDNIKYVSNKNEKERNDNDDNIQNESPESSHLSTNKVVIPEQYVYNIKQVQQNEYKTSNSEKVNNNLQDSANEDNFDKEPLKTDHENILNKIYMKSPLEEVIKIEKSENNMIEKDKDEDERETFAKNNEERFGRVEMKENPMNIQDEISIQPTNLSLEYSNETKNNHKIEPSASFRFRAAGDNSIDTNSNFKPSVTYIEPITVATVTTDKITTRTTNFDIKKEAESIAITINDGVKDFNRHTDSKFSSPATEVTQLNTDDKSKQEIGFTKSKSSSKHISDNVTSVTSNSDDRQITTNALFKNFNGTTDNINS